MTSLEKQLEKLKTAPTRSLAIERDHSSLLFDKKAAASLSREEFHKIGLNGLIELTKLDERFDEYEPGLFYLSTLHLQRSMQIAEEDARLNESLERMITHLSPYFLHAAGRQVLEWLIHKYQVHLYNAEFLAIAFSPFHSTNSYGRLLSILKFRTDEWEFAADYAKKGLPIPLNVLLRACSIRKGAGCFLVAALSDFLRKAVERLGREYCERRLQSHFTFFAILLVNLFDGTHNIDDQLIARLMPHIGLALKSEVVPFKYAGMMVVSQLVARIPLEQSILEKMIRLIWTRITREHLDVALKTTMLICQECEIALLPTSGRDLSVATKLIRESKELGLVESLKRTQEEGFEITSFSSALKATLRLILKPDEVDEELRGQGKALLREVKKMTSRPKIIELTLA